MAIVREAQLGPAHAGSAVQAHLGRALMALRGRGALAPKSVHDFRRELKRARAGLRLLRDTVAKSDYKQADACLRDAARPLGKLRDTDVALRTVGRLLSRSGLQEHRAALRRLRAGLQAEARALRTARAGEAARLLGPVALTAERVARWRLPREARPVLRSAFARIYENGRRAMRAARLQATDANLHEARKQVKYLGSALAILAAAGSKLAGKLARRAFEVADTLGDDHDLAALRPRLWRADRALAARVARRRARLQKDALAGGRKLYRWKTSRIAERLVPGGLRRD